MPFGILNVFLCYVNTDIGDVGSCVQIFFQIKVCILCLE